MNKANLKSILLLSFKWYLIFSMLNYGISKIFLYQFGVHDPNILDQPIKEIDKFYIAWYLFDQSTFFNLATGSIEIIAGILLIFRKTSLIGALLTLVCLSQILIIDIAFTMTIHGVSLPLRVSCMILANLFYLYNHKKSFLKNYHILVNSGLKERKYSWWSYLLFPLIGFLMDILLALITYPLKMVFELI